MRVGYGYDAHPFADDRADCEMSAACGCVADPNTDRHASHATTDVSDDDECALGQCEGDIANSATGAERSERTLVLGGVRFAGERPLAGHSDADVVAHAVIDAMLGAAGLGDIGTHFPDSAERWRDADSIEMLQQVAAHLGAHGWRLANADCTVICDRPKIAPYRESMQRRLSDAAGGPVTVCGKRTEGLGNSEGIVAHAVALVLADREQLSKLQRSGGGEQ